MQCIYFPFGYFITITLEHKMKNYTQFYTWILRFQVAQISVNFLLEC